MVKIYFDTCCYGRPYDNPKDARAVAETIAIMTIIEAARIAGYRIWGSPVVTFELGNIPDTTLRADIMGFYAAIVNDVIKMTPADFARALSIQANGVGEVDSQHLAAAESADVDYLITTDTKFESVVARKNLSKVKVINPLTYLVRRP
jgi:hypothetical protein